MKFLFIIQGEARGHLMQASTVARVLTAHGHEVTRALVGSGDQTETPLFFYKEFNARVETFESPRLVMRKDKKHPSFIRTVLRNISPMRLKRYLASMQMIRQRIDTDCPDVVVNFYEFLGGFMGLLFKFPMPIVGISSQNIFHHTDFEFHVRGRWDKFVFDVNTFMTNISATYRVGVSLRKREDEPNKNLFVLPPAVRPEIRRLALSDEGFILGYMDNEHYADEVMAWHEKHPEVKLFFFWTKEGVPTEWNIDDTLTFHTLDDSLFLEKLATCSGVACTGGFGTVAEALFLSKPLLIVPSQQEQELNALEAVALGGVVCAPTFDISLLMELVRTYVPSDNGYRAWVDSSEQLSLNLLTRK